MNILEDLPYDIEYIEPNNYLNDFVFTDLYNDFSKGMLEFLNKFMDANEKEVIQANLDNFILKYEFRKFIRSIKERLDEETCVFN